MHNYTNRLKVHTLKIYNDNEEKETRKKTKYVIFYLPVPSTYVMGVCSEFKLLTSEKQMQRNQICGMKKVNNEIIAEILNA